MEIALLIILGVVVVAMLYGIAIYNGLVALKHAVDNAWSNIDVLLKQRHDELPKLIETCRQYMRHAQETLARVTEARSAVASARKAGDVTALGTAEGALRAGLG
ncbi:MAG: LemA family protein, partial [Proteobacteria bacterium]